MNRQYNETDINNIKIILADKNLLRQPVNAKTSAS